MGPFKYTIHPKTVANENASFSSAVIPVGYYASYENIPIISHGGSDGKLGDKNKFDTLVRIRPGYHKIGSAVVEIMKNYKWKLAMVRTIAYKIILFAVWQNGRKRFILK